MFNKILILVTLCIYCYGTDPRFRYDYKYYKEANGWLKLHYAPMLWEDARLQCYYEGAVLASPLNNPLAIGIVKLFQDKKPCPNVMFSGVSASFADGIYTSVEGVPLERMSIYWSLNEPALRDGCLVFYSNGTMAAKSCLDYLPYVCYKKYEELIINECGTVDNEYQSFDESTKCYKYHSNQVNWGTAYKVCMAEGAHLATTFEYGDNFQRKQGTDIVSVGIKDFHGTWWDLDGKLILANNDRPNLTCGGRSWNGNFIPVFWNEKIPFICEKTIDSLLPYEPAD